MQERKGGEQLFREYYAHWVTMYKEGAVRPVTLAKYQMTNPGWKGYSQNYGCRI